MKQGWILLAAFLACAGSAGEKVSAPVFSPEPRIKFIECSWSNPTPEFLRENVRMLEEKTPYDGIRILLAGVDEKGRKLSHRMMFGRFRFRYEHLKPGIDALRQVKFRKFTDNFLATGVQPGEMDWFSDDDWRTICGNFALWARAARETGMKGLVFDSEEYSRKMWRFKDLPGRTYDEVVCEVRRRGREFGRAIFGEYPTIRLFWYLGLELVREYAEAPEAATLAVPFINGVYDVLPPGALMIEGVENGGYRAKNPIDYFRLCADMRKRFPRMIDRANLAKYRLQTSLAPAVYLDAYFADMTKTRGKFSWRDNLKPEIGKFGVLNLFRRNLRLAAEVSDCYVWTWGEHASWYPRTVQGKRVPLWTELAPGVDRVIAAAGSSDTGAAEAVRHAKAQKKPNLLGEKFAFASLPDAPRLSAPWRTYQDKRHSQGTIAVAGGRAVFTGTFEGLILRSIPVVPGREYCIVAEGELEVAASSPGASLLCRARFRRDGRFCDYRSGRLRAVALPGVKGRRKICFTVEASPEAREMQLQVQAMNLAPGARAYLDSLAVYEL